MSVVERRPRGNHEKKFLEMATFFSGRRYPTTWTAVYAMREQHNRVMPINASVKEEDKQIHAMIASRHPYVKAIEYVAIPLIKGERYADALRTANLLHQITLIDNQQQTSLFQQNSGQDGEDPKSRPDQVKDWIYSVNPDYDNDIFSSSLRFHRLLADQIFVSGRSRSLNKDTESAEILAARELAPMEEYDALRDYIHRAVISGDFDDATFNQFDPYAVIDARVVMDSYPLSSPPPVD